MSFRRMVLTLLAAGLVLGLIVAYFWGTPRLSGVSPVPGAAAVPAGTQLRLTFSRPMQAASVTRRLTIDPPLPGSFTWEGNTLIFNPDQPWPSAQTVSVRLEAGGRATGLLSLPLREDAAWTFTVGQPRLAYLYPAEGAASLYILDLSTGESRSLAEDLNGVLEYDVTTAGTAVYYSIKNLEGGSDIFRLEVDSPVDISTDQPPSLPENPLPTRVVSCGRALCRAPEVAPQGDYLAYEQVEGQGSGQSASLRVWLLPLSSDGLAAPGQSPVLAGEPDHRTEQPAWSPNGLLTFYDNNLPGFVILDPTTGETDHFSNQTGQPGSWDPSGTAYVAHEIAYIRVSESDPSDVATIANSHLILFNRLDGTTRDLSLAENLEDASPVFSPNGEWIAFSRKFLDLARWTPGRQLWVMRSNGEDARQLTDDPYYNHYEIVWSPDNRLLAFVRFNQTELIEPPELWVIRPDGTDAQQLVKGGYSPRWLP